MVYSVGSHKIEDFERCSAFDGLYDTDLVRNFVKFDQKVYGFAGLKVDCKRVKLMDSNQQARLPPSMSEESSPLGLTLRKTPSFLDLVEMKLSQGRKRAPPVEMMYSIGLLTEKAINDNFASRPIAEKLKASNFSALLLRIGSWERVSKHEGDLVAKCYYAKRKLVWEVLECGLKSKIEIQWSDISAIQAIFRENEPGILEIELNHPPLFFGETSPQPRKHTLWQATSDFTGGQAPMCRRHFVQFPEGTLEKHYEKLLQCDDRLYMLSQRPFPRVSLPPHFCLNHVQYQDYSCEPNVLGAKFSPVILSSFKDDYPSEYARLGNPRSTIVPSPQILKSEHCMPAIGPSDSSSPSSVIDFPPVKDTRTNLEHRRTPFSNDRIKNEINIGERNRDQIQELPAIASSNQVSPLLPQRISYNFLSSMDGMGRSSSNNWALNAITEHLLSDSPAPICSDEQKLAAPVNSMYPFPEASPLGLQLDSRYENMGRKCEEIVIENSMNDSAVSISSEQTNDDGSLCPISSDWLNFQESNVQVMTNLPRIASYPYLFLDQTTEDFADEEPNMAWNCLL